MRADESLSSSSSSVGGTPSSGRCLLGGYEKVQMSFLLSLPEGGKFAEEEQGGPFIFGACVGRSRLANISQRTLEMNASRRLGLVAGQR